MPHRFPSLIAAPPPARGRLWLTGARLFDGTGTPVRDGAAVLVSDGVIERVGETGESVPEGARALDLGGLQSCNSYTKINLSLFDLYPRRFVPSVPPEVVLAEGELEELVSEAAAEEKQSARADREVARRMAPGGHFSAIKEPAALMRQRIGPDLDVDGHRRHSS